MFSLSASELRALCVHCKANILAACSRHKCPRHGRYHQDSHFFTIEAVAHGINVCVTRSVIDLVANFLLSDVRETLR